MTGFCRRYALIRPPSRILRKYYHHSPMPPTTRSGWCSKKHHSLIQTSVFPWLRFMHVIPSANARIYGSTISWRHESEKNKTRRAKLAIFSPVLAVVCCITSSKIDNVLLATVCTVVELQSSLVVEYTDSFTCHTRYKHGQQKRCPHRVTTGSRTPSRQMLHSKCESSPAGPKTNGKLACKDSLRN